MSLDQTKKNFGAETLWFSTVKPKNTLDQTKLYQEDEEAKEAHTKKPKKKPTWKRPWYLPLELGNFQHHGPSLSRYRAKVIILMYYSLPSVRRLNFGNIRQLTKHTRFLLSFLFKFTISSTEYRIYRDDQPEITPFYIFDHFPVTGGHPSRYPGSLK